MSSTWTADLVLIVAYFGIAIILAKLLGLAGLPTAGAIVLYGITAVSCIVHLLRNRRHKVR